MENKKEKEFQDVPDSISLDISAEKTTFNTLIQAPEMDVAEENIFIESEQEIPSPLPELPLVEPETFKTPEMAATNINPPQSADLIKDEFDKFKNNFENSILPYISDITNAVSNNLSRKDGDKNLEKRTSHSNIIFVFDDRLTEITDYPKWA